MSFKLTYSTMFDPPAEMHVRFEAALSNVRTGMGASHAMYVDGLPHHCARMFEKRSPIDRTLVMGHFPDGNVADVEQAVAAAKRAFPLWRSTSGKERVALMRRAAELIEEEVYRIAATLALEVGKNRMEALGEAQETADFFTFYAAEFERNAGYESILPDDPVAGYRSHNRSVLKPYGVWGVIAPFNFPLALAGGPTAAALVTGNTVVLKGSTETPWAGALLAECLHRAGVPPGVFNYVIGRGAVAGEALIGHADIAGVTFTGSYDVGMHIHRKLIGGIYPRPCIAEMGGKNACIVTAAADLDRAAAGIVRSAYGLSGQKCSALSRVYVEDAAADALIARLVRQTSAIRVGDPTVRDNWMGPVISEAAVAQYLRCCGKLAEAGSRILVGGTRLLEGDYANGHFVSPTLAEAPPEHPLYHEEMFQPILMVARVKDISQGIAFANAVPFALTGGCYGNQEDVRYFFENIDAGVTYANRPQGATTGAWPGYQPFGGWKGSGSTGKAIGSTHYLPLYLREQSQTVVE